MALNLRQIEVFRAVMITGSISGAAQLLFVSQPAVSRLLSQTETRLGYALFERIKGRLHATPEAKKLFREVQSVYAGIQRVNAMAENLADNRQGTLNIVCSTSVGQMFIPQAIASFLESFPRVKLNFMIMSYAHLLERLLDHQADLGVITSPMEHPNLTMAPLSENRLVCLFPQGHPLEAKSLVSLEELAPYPLVTYDKGTPFGALIEQLYEAKGLALDPLVEVGSPHSASALVQLGTGIALVDEFSVKGAPGKLAMRAVVDSPVVQINLVHHRLEPMSKLTRAFVEVLRDLVQRIEAPLEHPPAPGSRAAKPVSLKVQ
ncbi:MAG TPA: LysR substrate-binding domain-containing protein [Ramlibacter sp.]|jgi:DNA-binding transcriptional LysR family regulator|nr:LysR substrate-binding domain-containing protein [Ramlibacter sp.]